MDPFEIVDFQYFIDSFAEDELENWQQPETDRRGKHNRETRLVRRRCIQRSVDFICTQPTCSCCGQRSDFWKGHTCTLCGFVNDGFNTEYGSSLTVG